MVVGAGDFATMHEGLESTIEVLSAIAVPAVLVPGNAETDVELWQAWLVLCGHIHQCWGREATIGTTPVVNVGPDGRAFDI